MRYEKRPVSPSAIAAAQAVRVFDPAKIASRLATLTPAQHLDPGRWDRLALFAALLDNNADIAASRAAVARATAEERAAHASPGPTLTLTSEYAGAAPEASPWLFGGVVDVPLDVGGRRAARIDSAGLKIAVARYDYLEMIWTARQALRTALVDRAIAVRQAEAGTQLTALRERHFAAVARRVVAGETTRADLERIRADLSDARRRAADAAARVIAETRAIAALTGVPVSELSEGKVKWDDFDAPALSVSDPAARRSALVARADILRVVVAYDQSEADLRGEVARQYPAISVGPGFTWERGLVKLPFSLGFVLPPLDLNRRAIFAAEGRRAEAGRLLEAAVANASAAIDAAETEARAAREALAAIRRSELPAARALAAQAERELRAGAIDRTDWAASQSGVLIARLAELDALARVHAADTALELALRRPLSGPELNIVGSPEALQ
ncbi:TolC family protein [Sphingomonas sp. SUN039]|uniref:TolC family protein n=1 Tax=Sphingomonas sp. SUN039 TaxID=2937787 RepID=UPI0021643959|nr:TolC family protein [Sphingomonas sp. SUN039]UVO53752.1 TolC family protein [Sphingomonas sp. SUN039]